LGDVELLGSASEVAVLGEHDEGVQRVEGEAVEIYSSEL
jgi:hypothetical protein